MHNKLLKFNNIYQMMVWLFLVFFSIISSSMILLNFNLPQNYGALFVLPLSFLFVSIIFSNVYTRFFENIGITLIIVLSFLRLVILPLLMSIYGCESRIASNPNGNMTDAIFLMAWEIICIFFMLMMFVNNQANSIHSSDDEKEYKKQEYADRMYLYLLMFALLLLIFCLAVSPQIMQGYRTIFQISDEKFTSYEDTQLVNTYATSTIKKFAIVTGNYLMRALIAIVPGYLIIKISEKKTLTRKAITFCCCFIPLFFIGGIIARSLIYVVCLLLLFFYIYTPKKISKKTATIIGLAAVTVIGWWTFRYDSAYGLQELTGTLSAYFSGVNNVYASYNLDRDIKTRLLYFIYDYMDAIPYSGTIFKSNHVIISDFFNKSNGVRGQIPTTIGMGMYYFGSVLAPIYSVVFAYFSARCGEKVQAEIKNSPLKGIRLLLTAMYLSMGIVTYSISITLMNFFTILLPMYIMESIAYKKRSDKID